ncbi:MAG: hypothetical protein K0S07_724 [Chlamydiales bacterium]|jgi:manganese/zinc/iron transport system permease protein|nr:hypothetical protein [Chlamydiales bacterium]
MDLFHYFLDPVLRGPTIGSMLMCFASALIGVLTLLRKQALVGEALSHAIYPGVIGGVLIGFLAGVEEDSWLGTGFVFASAFLIGLLALLVIDFLERHLKRSDSALCFVLASFFGVGILLHSYLQDEFPFLLWKVQIYLFGQAATMTDFHIAVYFLLASLIVLILLVFYKEILTLSFDPSFSQTLALPTRFIRSLIALLLILAIVIGVRSVGVVLMSAMLIAPAVSARVFAKRLSQMFYLAGAFGLLSGLIGNVLSIEGSRLVALHYPGHKISFPTGPMIVLSASFFAFLFLGLQGRTRRLKKASFQRAYLKDLVLLSLLKGRRTLEELKALHAASSTSLFFLLWQMRRRGLIAPAKGERTGSFQLQKAGLNAAQASLERHRLWLAYLSFSSRSEARLGYANPYELEQSSDLALKQSLKRLCQEEIDG